MKGIAECNGWYFCVEYSVYFFLNVFYTRVLSDAILVSTDAFVGWSQSRRCRCPRTHLQLHLIPLPPCNLLIVIGILI